MNIDKAISIRCEGKITVLLKDLNYFQEKLKTIDENKFKDLKNSLIKNGLPLGFHIWIDSKEKIWIIDGHHRYLGLKALESEGFYIPPIPVVKVLAKTKKEAANIVLISNSRYAKMNQDSFSEYLVNMDLSLQDVEYLDFHEFETDIFKTDFAGIKEESLSDVEENFNFTIKCKSHEEYKQVQEFFDTDASKINFSTAKTALCA